MNNPEPKEDFQPPHWSRGQQAAFVVPIHWCSSDHEHTPAAGDYVFPGEEEEVQVSGALHTGGADSSAFRQRSAFLQDPAGWWWGLCHLVIQVFTTHHFLVIRQSLPEVNLPQSWTMSFLPLFICWHCAVFSKQCSTRLCYIQVVNVCLLVVFHLRFGKRNWHQPLVQYVLLHPCVSWECCLHDGSPLHPLLLTLGTAQYNWRLTRLKKNPLLSIKARQ